MDPGVDEWAFHCHQSGFSVSCWDTRGCTENRHQWLGGSTIFSRTLVCSPLLSPHSQHLSPTCHPEPPTTCCFAMSPVASSSIPACLPRSLPSPAIALCLSTSHTSPLLHSPPPFSLSLSNILSGCVLIPHPEQTNSAKQTNIFPHLKTKPTPNHLTIPKLQPQPCFSKEIWRKHPTANRSVYSRGFWWCTFPCLSPALLWVGWQSSWCCMPAFTQGSGAGSGCRALAGEDKWGAGSRHAWLVSVKSPFVPNKSENQPRSLSCVGKCGSRCCSHCVHG